MILKSKQSIPADEVLFLKVYLSVWGWADLGPRLCYFPIK